MIDAKRHVPLGSRAWDSAAAQTAIDDIVEDAHARLDEARFWPAHPQDEGAEDGDTSLYMGAAGVIWALDHLARTRATPQRHNLVSLRHRLVEAARQQRASPGDYGLHGSLHFDDFPALLASMRLLPETATADAIH